ncbi:MAG TPA: hypothetical protein VGH74_06260 [Planctomycetaceae bacterium]|jgi:hypothetical protein
MSEKTPPGKDLWNKISGLAGKILRPAGEPEPDSADEPELTVEQRRLLALDALRSLLAGKKGTAALALYHKTVQLYEGWELPEKELLQLAELVCDEKLWLAAVPLLENYLQRFSSRVVPVRLKLAKILIEQQQRPSYASRILAELPRDGLGEKEEKLRTSLTAKAQKMIDEGVLELEGRAW